MVRWPGAPEDVERGHHVEWTVEEDIAWAGNTRPTADTTPALHEDGDQIVLRGRLNLTGDGAAFLDLGSGTQILFDLADPPPPDEVHGTWVEIRVRRESVSLWPYLV
ncbi:hypothetical protein HEK616_37920 [Streptomyces nigrescens]|uniref:Uncharacterized protein n=2 Tax=Streptomyces TaxID=1883 RepID=A0ABN6QYE1_STRNI|nr:hypothetical protein [Streptomyces nigrescens]MEE4419329.1 hypothetical protein [Streptomyces sp. DSM 41528]BDM70305.1 hypothetical protein HEK616_37920 [Streptomyces nigrescens]